MSRCFIALAAAAILLPGCDRGDPASVEPIPGPAAALVSTTWPSADDPGPPYYARIEPPSPHVYNDGDWAAIVFYRDPGCVPPGFNLLAFFDVPTAFGCSLTVEGAALWRDAPFSGAPWISTSSGAGAVPVWFAPMTELQPELTDGVLTIGELAAVTGLLVGSADHFHETLAPRDGPHPRPKLVVSAHGRLEDGRRFHLRITSQGLDFTSTRISFR